MAQEVKRMIDRLNDLIAVDHDAISAYGAAIERIEHSELRGRLSEFQADHQRHISDLSGCVVALGGKPRQGRDVKGFVLKGFTAVTSMMGNEAALRAMQGNEMLTNRSYENANREIWPDDIRAVISRNLSDEKRHLAYIEEALRLRPWESTGAHP